ncbi:hypothetical protein TRFO_35050 [Tritrichomonas foetus]|uniref:GTP-binding protein n=1 Tax=Tritrichomonas foetus TaxID=1144522 RepID=A0A1J4JJJ8_9EUKA|nr:hypothetical protein TRFO_35050 [Tritrichomonas foetus]|eukprot:OHS98519.1 hypothetical protein TRFO_35050 [Tritrichomonas foetus]
MSYLADIYRNFDAHFAEENASMVSFPNCTEVGSIVFIGAQGSGKYAILGQLTEKFRHTPGTPHIEEDVKSEIRNVIFKVPIVACPPNFSASSNPLSIFEKCQTIILIIDSTAEAPMELILSINNIKESLVPQPDVHVFLHKTDLLDAFNAENTLSSLKENVLEYIPDAKIHHTSINNGTALFEVSQCIERIIPKRKELKAAMLQFSRSLELSNAFLVDLQSRSFLLSSGDSRIDGDQFLMVQDGVEMFVGIATMMDAKSAQPIMSVELKDGTFLHFFWSTYDVILAGISDHRSPPATAKNNVLALLHSIKKILR